MASFEVRTDKEQCPQSLELRRRCDTGLLETAVARRRRAQVPAKACTPKLNPVEYIWGRLKHHAMLTCSAANLGDLRRRARRKPPTMQRRSTTVRASWRQPGLSWNA